MAPRSSLLVPTRVDWEKEIAAFEAIGRTTPPPTGGILFIGSSSIRLWKTLESDFPNHRVINRGFGGSQMIDSVYYFDRIVLPCKPRQILIYAGANDIHAGKKGEQVLADFKLFVEKTKRFLPGTRVDFISIAGNPSRWGEINEVRKANRVVREFARWERNVGFIDTHSAMMNEQGEPKPEIFVEDRLHMNENGYAIWREIIRDHLTPEKEAPAKKTGW
ncbi:MAG: SGNH/GDSL hydrolase family protein [Verrucomicrobiota bacterium]|nr:SGNH/GDSL hydrolase family protein [Verrucomicrobiota bacterium]